MYVTCFISLPRWCPSHLIYLPLSRILYQIPSPAFHKDPLLTYKNLIFAFLFLPRKSYIFAFTYLFIPAIPLTKKYQNQNNNYWIYQNQNKNCWYRHISHPSKRSSSYPSLLPDSNHIFYYKICPQKAWYLSLIWVANCYKVFM